ncbi:MAG: hypothetical protein IKV86_01985 [Clostridia bacterium]|nr:hypothetical protein [Clostridia bacterium]
MTNVINFIQQIIYVLIIVLIIGNYVITAKAVYGIAKKLNLRKIGFPWVFFASSFVLANISDQFDNDEGSTKKFGRNLRVTTLVAAVIIGFTFVVFLYSIATITDALFIREVAFVFTAFLYMMLLAATVFIFFRFIYTILCVYKIFKHIRPDKAAKYLLISLVLPLAKALLLMKCKNEFCSSEESADDCELCDDRTK